MIQRFITRPVLSTVVSIILVILGVLGYLSLPVSLYPEIAPPTIQVNASYPGATPKRCSTAWSRLWRSGSTAWRG